MRNVGASSFSGALFGVTRAHVWRCAQSRGARARNADWRSWFGQEAGSEEQEAGRDELAVDSAGGFFRGACGGGRWGRVKSLEPEFGMPTQSRGHGTRRS